MKTIKISQLISLIMLSIFTGTFLFIAAVVVPFWQSSEASYLFNWFAENFSRFPILMIPLNLIAFLTTITALICSWNLGIGNRIIWGSAFILIFLSSITYPIYFASANNLFLEQTIQLSDVSHELVAWSFWHWMRTLLSFFAVVFAAIGVYKESNVQN